MENSVEIFNDKSFTFDYEFTCFVRDGVVYVQEYGEGAFPLSHIKTTEQFIALYEIFTGLQFDIKAI